MGREITATRQRHVCLVSPAPSHLPPPSPPKFFSQIFDSRPRARPRHPGRESPSRSGRAASPYDRTIGRSSGGRGRRSNCFSPSRETDSRWSSRRFLPRRAREPSSPAPPPARPRRRKASRGSPSRSPTPPASRRSPRRTAGRNRRTRRRRRAASSRKARRGSPETPPKRESSRPRTGRSALAGRTTERYPLENHGAF